MEIFVFSGRIWPDWGNAAWADMAGLGSIGLSIVTNYPLRPIPTRRFMTTLIIFLIDHPLV